MFSLVTVSEVLIWVIIFFQWFYEYYRISDNELISHRGTFLTRRKYLQFERNRQDPDEPDSTGVVFQLW